MAENTRGQNRNGNRHRSEGPAPNSHEANKRNRASQGLRDTNLDRVRSDNRTPKSSGFSNKANISGTDYDGQLSDE